MTMANTNASGKSAKRVGILSGLAGFLSFKPLVYGYANARVHGLYSQLLDAEMLKQLMAAPSSDALVEVLERTSYKDDLVALSLHFKGDDLVELAVGAQFARYAEQLLDICPARDKSVLQALLSRWDAHNLKVVLLARRQKEPFEKIAPYLVLAGSLKEAELKEIYGAPNADEVYRLIRLTSTGAALSDLLRSSSLGEAERFHKLILSLDKTTSMQPILDEFDRLSYRLAAAATQSYVSEGGHVPALVMRMADEKNLSTVLRLSEAGAKPADIRRYLVPGGMVSDNKWISLISAGGISNLITHLDSRLGWKAALEEYSKHPSSAALEVSLAQVSARKSVRIFHNSQMSLGVIVGALLLKEQEMSNIRKIVRAKSLRLPVAEIEKMLVQVR